MPEGGVPAIGPASRDIVPGVVVGKQYVIPDENKVVDTLGIKNVSTKNDSDPVKLNSRDFTRGSGDNIAFQSKPNQTVASTGSVYGAQVSPRAASGIAVANLIGFEASPILKGTAAGTISGDVRAFDAIIESEGSARTVGGDVMSMRCRLNFPINPTGHIVPIKVLNAEQSPGTWDAFVKFEGDQAGVWKAAPATEPTTADGYIKVLFGTTARYIALFSGAPVD